MKKWYHNIWGFYPTARRCLVNLKSGTVFNGIVWQKTGSFLVLRNAQLLSDRGSELKNPPQLDGETLVQLADVDFIQVL